MPTDAQISANQANAALSTGPRTDEGKAASSRNHLRHGFRSQSVLLPGEDPAGYDALLTELTEHFITPDHFNELAELRFVREMADAEWRLRRIRRCMEDALTRRISTLAAERPEAGPVTLQTLAIETLSSDGGPSYGTWLRYETKYERQYDRAYKGWTDFHKALRRAMATDAEIALKRSFSRPAPANLGSNVQNFATPLAVPLQTPRNAPCPCGSGEKYKRCCGKNAPPVLSTSIQEAA